MKPKKFEPGKLDFRQFLPDVQAMEKFAKEHMGEKDQKKMEEIERQLRDPEFVDLAHAALARGCGEKRKTNQARQVAQQINRPDLREGTFWHLAWKGKDIRAFLQACMAWARAIWRR